MEIYNDIKRHKVKKTKTPFTLVLDLDETLVRTYENLMNLRKSKILKNPEFYPIRSQLYVLTLEDDDDENKLWGFRRPYLRDFLQFASEYFENVCVWSAGTSDYVYEVCNHIFEDYKPDLILTRDHCEMIDDVPYKPLKKLYEMLPKANEKNTIMIDDRDDVMKLNPNNGIIIPSYTPNTKNIKTIT
jgi:TFIIF-interacting CTD phosphatase-like protein